MRISRDFKRMFVVTVGLIATVLATDPTAAFAQKTSQFRGTVLSDDREERPLSNAEIIFVSLKRTVRSDSLGNFVFNDIPFGQHAMVVRLAGFDSITTQVTLSTEHPPGVDLLMKPTPGADRSQGVNSPYRLRLAEFYERRSKGHGKFVTAEYFEQHEGKPLSTFMHQKISALKFVSVNGRNAMVAYIGQGAEHCYVQIVLNGIIRFNGMGQIPFDIDALNTADIIGFEYHVLETTPEKYLAHYSVCGTAIIWSRGV